MSQHFSVQLGRGFRALYNSTLTLKWCESRTCERILEAQTARHCLSHLFIRVVLQSSEPRTNLDAVFWTRRSHWAESETSVTATSAHTSRLALHQPNSVRLCTIGLAVNQGGSCVAWGNTRRDISSLFLFWIQMLLAEISLFFWGWF